MQLIFERPQTLQNNRAWAGRRDDALPSRASLDFRRSFLPDGLARVVNEPLLSATERLKLNQIRGHAYLAMFELAHAFILPFVLDHLRGGRLDDEARSRALLAVAGEEAEHIELFKRFRRRFVAGFGTGCKVAGCPDDIRRRLRAHVPLTAALLALHFEWMTHRHYLEVLEEGDSNLDPQFEALLRTHWIDAAKHAKLDRAIAVKLSVSLDRAGRLAAVDGYLSICAFLDEELRRQARFDLEALERCTGVWLLEREREVLLVHQHQANRWTYLGSGMRHPEVLSVLETIGSEARDRVERVGPLYC